MYCQWFVYHHLKGTDVGKFAASIFRGNQPEGKAVGFCQFCIIVCQTVAVSYPEAVGGRVLQNPGTCQQEYIASFPRVEY